MRLFLLSLLLFLTFQMYAQHQWTRTNPGGGGAIAMVGATADGTIVTASDLSGIYVSTDNGDSWEVFGAVQGLTQTHISSLGFHPEDGQTFLIGTGIGVFKTTDGGHTITESEVETSPNNGLGYIESIGMAMSDNYIGYLAHYEDWLPELSFMKTMDGGDSWKIVNTTGIPADARVVKILVDWNNANIVYVLTGKARFGCSNPNLYRSIDGGKKWVRIGKTDEGFPQILDFDLHPTNPEIIYMSTFVEAADGCNLPFWEYVSDTGAFYKSTNGGTSFEKITDQDGNDHSGIISVGTDPNRISLIEIINTDKDDSNSGTWKTSDGGTTWQHTGRIEDWDIVCAHPDYAYGFSYNGLVKTLTKDRFKPDRLYGAFGQWSWSTIDGGNHINNISCRKVNTDQYISTGMDNIEGNWLDVNDSNSDIVYVGYYDLGFWYSKNHGASWTKSFPSTKDFPDYSWWAGGGSNCNFVVSDPERAHVVWATFSADQPETKGALFKSTEYGENWKRSNAGLKPFGLSMHGMSVDVNSDTNMRTLYLTQEGEVYKSINDGEEWNKITDIGGLKFTAVDKMNSQIIYAGGENGFWRSKDGGTEWQEVGLPEMHFITSVPGAIMRPDIVPTYDELESNPKILAWQGVFDIKADPNIENRVYVIAYGKNKGLYRSDDAGSTWQKLYTNDKMRGVAIAKYNSNIVYASSSASYHSGGHDVESKGIIVSYDAGTTWGFANDGMAWTYGGRLDIETGSKPYIWAWSPGVGVQHALIPNFVLGGEKIFMEESEIQVYPNPSKKILKVDMTKVSRASTAAVYSITGALLSKIHLNAKSVNTVDISTLLEGVYFLKITNNSFSKTYKFVKK